ncbi:unnamed protein product [Ectocarpus sp. 13 AM-2016]
MLRRRAKWERSICHPANDTNYWAASTSGRQPTPDLPWAPLISSLIAILALTFGARLKIEHQQLVDVRASETPVRPKFRLPVRFFLFERARRQQYLHNRRQQYHCGQHYHLSPPWCGSNQIASNKPSTKQTLTPYNMDAASMFTNAVSLPSG